MHKNVCLKLCKLRKRTNRVVYIIKKYTKPGYFFVNSENSRQATPKNAGKTDVNDFEKMTNCLSTICNSKKPIHLLSGRKADRWGVS